MKIQYQLTQTVARGILLSGVISLSLTQSATAAEVTCPNATLTGNPMYCFSPNTSAKSGEVNANFKRLLDLINAQNARIAALEAKLAAVNYDATAKTLQISNANLQIVSGSGTTDGTPNGYGNLIVGYNKAATRRVCSNGSGTTSSTCTGTWAANQRSGSHNIVIGDMNDYTQFGGLVLGAHNAIVARNASVTGGYQNTASAPDSSVSGGYNNIAIGTSASVSGGRDNTASSYYASVSGGLDNTASGHYASVSGGRSNTARVNYASVSGGHSNSASGEYASVSGGVNNSASGHYASVSGGFHNNAGGNSASISGGRANIASGEFASVSGGEGNKALGNYSSGSGGSGNRAIGDYSAVSGGSASAAHGLNSSISGGYSGLATGESSSVSGGRSERALRDYQARP